MIRLALFFVAAALSLQAAPVCSSGTWSGTTCTGGSRPITYTFSGGTATNAEIQAVITDSQLGDFIHTPPTQITITSTLLFKKKSGSGVLTFRTSEYAKLPPNDTRVTPAYLPLMTRFMRTTSLPIMAFQGGWQVAEDIKIEGIQFKTDPTASKVSVFGAPLVNIGPASGGNASAFAGCTNKIAPDTTYTDTFLTSAALIGATSLAVTAGTTTGASPGDILYVSSSTGTARVECVEIDNISGDTINLVDALTVDHNSADYVRVIAGKPEHLPDDIEIRHCIFDNESGQIRNRRYIQMGARRAVIADNIMDRPMDYGLSDFQQLHSSSGYGPHIVTNNWLCGAGEQIMYGGSYPPWDTELQSLDAQYNYFCYIEERDRLGLWPGPGATVHKGKFVYNATYDWFVATNSGITTDTLPGDSFWNVAVEGTTAAETGSCATAGPGGSNACITWRRTGASSRPATKNLFEIKSGRNQHLNRNVFDGWWEALAYNTNQQYALQIKAVSLNVTSSVACDSSTIPYPACYEGKSDGFQLTNSVLRFQTGGAIALTSYTAGSGTHWGNILIDNVLITRTAPTLRLMAFGAMLNEVQDSPGLHWEPNSFTIRNITAVNTTAAATTLSWSEHFPNSATPGPNYIFGNIFPRGTAGMSSSFGEGSSGSNIPTTYGTLDRTIGLAPYTDTFFKNAIIGGGTVSYPSGSMLGNCTGTSACVEFSGGAPAAWTYNHPTYGVLFRDFANRDYRVRPSHTWAKNSLPDGRSVGANLALLPLINDLAVQPTDRMALVTWTLTEANRDMGCIIDVNAQEDFLGAYVGDQSDIATYYGSDQASHDSYIKRGLDRMVIVGKNINLSPSTTYYYRLHCGGDTRRGSFTTKAAVSGTKAIKIGDASASSMTYGTYSRTTGALTSGGSGSCGSGICTATLPRGVVTFTKINSGRVQPTVVQ